MIRSGLYYSSAHLFNRACVWWRVREREGEREIKKEKQKMRVRVKQQALTD
jgi:hypothetical protein